jgi:hypothetical protein
MDNFGYLANIIYFLLLCLVTFLSVVPSVPDLLQNLDTFR